MARLARARKIRPANRVGRGTGLGSHVRVIASYHVQPFREAGPFNPKETTMAQSSIRAAKSWREVLKLHPAAELFPPLSPSELKELGEDIKTNGLQSPPLIWVDRVDTGGSRYLLDGRNRLDAMEAVGLPVLNERGALFRRSKRSSTLSPDITRGTASGCRAATTRMRSYCRSTYAGAT